MPRFYRLFIDGTLAQGAETWCTGIAFASLGGGPPESSDLSVWCESVRTAMEAGTGWPATLKGAISTSGKITKVRAYAFPGIGAPADVAGESNGAAIDGTGSPSMPPQCSVVVSLLTGRPGKSYRGRMYLPLCGGAITAGQQSGYVSQNFTNSMASMVVSLQSLGPDDLGVPVVVSVAANVLTAVSSVSVDTVIDTQRRRRENLIGTRYTAVV